MGTTTGSTESTDFDSDMPKIDPQQINVRLNPANKRSVKLRR